jgi:Universal stress protein UspA and related nucleotide-binding proteins
MGETIDFDPAMRILLALDGSPSSLDARDLVAGLRWPPATAITIVAAFDVPIAWTTNGFMAGDWFTDAETALRRQAQEALAAMTGPLENRGWTIDQRVVQGRAATAIISAAEDVDADLIVLGSRGHGPIRSMLLGSVSAEVIGHTDRSVLVARGKQVSRALVATDGSDCTSILPDVLAEWGILRGLEAVVLSVAPADWPALGLMIGVYTLGDDSIQRQHEEELARHRAIAGQMAERLSGIGVAAQEHVQTGDAAHEILKAARDRHCDLIVTGSRCLHGVDRWLLGSVARNVVLHADASVLIIRARARSGIGNRS